jgi:hypothetical protein
MHRNSSAKRAASAGSAWPDLQHKYRKLAIPAVAAAILPDRETARKRMAESQRSKPSADGLAAAEEAPGERGPGRAAGDASRST